MTHDEILIEIDGAEVGIKNLESDLQLGTKKIKDLETKIDGTRTLKSQFASVVYYAKSKAKVVDFGLYVDSKKSIDSCENVLKTLFPHHADATKNKLSIIEALEMAKKHLQKLKDQEKAFGNVIRHDFRRSTRANKKG